MKSIWQILSLALITLTVACNTVEPVQGVESVSVPTTVQQKYSTEDIGKMISAAALNKGWQVDQEQQGLIHVTLHWRNYSAEAGVNAAVSCVKEKCQTESHNSGATIIYSQQSYSISPDPDPSENLPSGITYRQFNKYIERLKREIDKNLTEAAHR